MNDIIGVATLIFGAKIVVDSVIEDSPLKELCGLGLITFGIDRLGIDIYDGKK